jgi:four helix bundle protein
MLLCRTAMTPQELRKRTKTFALDVIRFYRTLPGTEAARVIGRQLLRSGTAVGAHYRAACRRRSYADFVNKLATTLEEADESGYWLELLVEGQIVALPRAARLVGEAEELTRIFSAAYETAKFNAQARRAASKRPRRTESPDRSIV